MSSLMTFSKEIRKFGALASTMLTLRSIFTTLLYPNLRPLFVTYRVSLESAWILYPPQFQGIYFYLLIHDFFLYRLSSGLDIWRKEIN